MPLLTGEDDFVRRAELLWVVSQLRLNPQTPERASTERMLPALYFTTAMLIVSFYSGFFFLSPFAPHKKIKPISLAFGLA